MAGTTPAASGLQARLQEAQSALNLLAQNFWQHLPWNASEASSKMSAAAPNCDNLVLGKECFDKNEATRRRDRDLRTQMEAWKENPSWTDHPARLQISTPKGTLCQIESSFQVGIPPDAVYDIITDPENKRVFKSIKEVTYRNILEDEGHRQLVEVEQSAIWRFLWFSGIMSIHLYVRQDRQAHSLSYRLAKEGFMKKFEGAWDVKPVYVDAPHCERLANPKDEPSCRMSRVASEVHFRQMLQPILVPPPPISWYIRGISRRQTECLLEDLQAEAKRLREGNEQDSDQLHQTEDPTQNSFRSEHMSTSAQGQSLPSRRRRKNIR